MSEAWDAAAWRELATELDAWHAAGHEASLWWRDDDAGRADPALVRLLALSARSAVPLGLAVVPTWLTSDGAAGIHAAPASVVVLQHGFAHANHETAIAAGEGKVRPAECGAGRPGGAALEEVRVGRDRLDQAFAGRFLPVFVPPWNRIAPAVVHGLAAVGHRAVSAFGPRSAAAAAPGLVTLNCHVDPIAWREAKRFVGARTTLERLRAHLTARREGRADREEPTGLLTHHRDMDGAFWACLETLLERLRAHPGAALPPLPALLASQAAAPRAGPKPRG